MIADLKKSYADTLRFGQALPWIIAVVVAVEFAQHAGEISLGMYDSMVQARAVEQAPLRMGLGHAKVLALALLGYAVARFIGFGRDAAAAVRLEFRAVRLFGWVLAFGVVWIVIGLDGGPLLMAAGVDEASAGRVIAVLMGAGFLFQILLVPWKMAAPLGNAQIGFGRSIGLAWRHLPWGLVFKLVAILPVMALHYGLFLGVIGQGRAVAWVAAAVDAVVVGYLGVLLIAVEMALAQRMVAANGVALLPAGLSPAAAPATRQPH